MTTLLKFDLLTQCDELVAEGAVLGQTPAEVVQACEITFAMLADPAAAEAVGFQYAQQQPSCTPPALETGVCRAFKLRCCS